MPRSPITLPGDRIAALREWIESALDHDQIVDQFFASTSLDDLESFASACGCDIDELYGTDECEDPDDDPTLDCICEHNCSCDAEELQP